MVQFEQCYEKRRHRKGTSFSLRIRKEIGEDEVKQRSEGRMEGASQNVGVEVGVVSLHREQHRHIRGVGGRM